MIKIRIPFGFKTVLLDDLLTLYTGKIRIKADLAYVKEHLKNHPEIVVSTGRNSTVMISFITTDYVVSSMYRELIWSMIGTIMHQRIDAKYSNQTVVDCSLLADDLPW